MRPLREARANALRASSAACRGCGASLIAVKTATLTMRPRAAGRAGAGAAAGGRGGGGARGARGGHGAAGGAQEGGRRPRAGVRVAMADAGAPARRKDDAMMAEGQVYRMFVTRLGAWSTF